MEVNVLLDFFFLEKGSNERGVFMIICDKVYRLKYGGVGFWWFVYIKKIFLYKLDLNILN